MFLISLISAASRRRLAPFHWGSAPPTPQGFSSPTGSLWDLKDAITQSNHTILNTLSQAKNHNTREGSYLAPPAVWGADSPVPGSSVSAGSRYRVKQGTTPGVKWLSEAALSVCCLTSLSVMICYETAF